MMNTKGKIAEMALISSDPGSPTLSNGWKTSAGQELPFSVDEVDRNMGLKTIPRLYFKPFLFKKQQRSKFGFHV